MSTSSDCEIVTTRIMNAPRETVYRAWTEPDHLKNWWGPAGFTNTFHEFDLRPGGKWIFTMHGPDKGHYQNECEFLKIEKPSFISWDRISKPHFQIAATFDELPDSRTNVTFKMIFASAEECNKLKPYVVDKNEENFDRLQLELSTMI